MHLFNRILFSLLIAPGCAGHPSETALPATQSEYGLLPERFTGFFYEVGWEREVFRPCGLQEEWWTWSGGRIIQDDPRGWGRVFVVLEGRVSARSSYGHRGRYPRQIVITRLIEIRPADGTCPASTEDDELRAHAILTRLTSLGRQRVNPGPRGRTACAITDRRRGCPQT